MYKYLLIILSLVMISCSGTQEEKSILFKDGKISFKYDVKCIDWEKWKNSRYEKEEENFNNASITLIKILSSYDELCDFFLQKNKFDGTYSKMYEEAVKLSEKVNNETVTSHDFKFSGFKIENVVLVNSTNVIKIFMKREDGKYAFAFKFLNNKYEYSFIFMSNQKNIDVCKKWRDDILSTLIIND